MSERLRHHLHPDVHKALRMAQRVSGKEPIVKRVDDLPHNTRAVHLRPVIPDRPYEIQHRRGEERVFDHLITHELGHIVRLHRVPDAERLAAFVSPECRARAARQLAADGKLVPLLAQGVAPENVVDLMSDWHEALAIQVANGPVDLRIEQWISNRFPAFGKSRRSPLPRKCTAATHRWAEELELTGWLEWKRFEEDR